MFLFSQKMFLAPIEIIPSQNAPSRQEKSPAPDRSRIAWLVLILFGFSGFAALSLEVSWSRVLTMILGSSVYAFSIILTTFLLGIALGSWIISKFIDRLKNLLAWFTAIEIALGISEVLGNWLDSE